MITTTTTINDDIIVTIANTSISNSNNNIIINSSSCSNHGAAWGAGFSPSQTKEIRKAGSDHEIVLKLLFAHSEVN